LRKQSFGAHAALYDRARPVYPEQLFDDLLDMAGIPKGGRVLEIGPGTGQATLPLARRGCSVLGIELSPQMARRCRANCREFPEVEVKTMAFEDWPVEPAAFDLVVSASAFHWVRPGVGFSHAAAALKPSGHIALIWVFREDQTDPLSMDLHEAYRALGLKPWRARPPTMRSERQREAIAQSGRFGPVTVRGYPSERDYSANDYIALLRTMSDHAIMPADVRRKLFAEIRKVFARHGGIFTRRFIATLLLAPKR
jgi:SAM-dependent methyltransferase